MIPPQLVLQARAEARARLYQDGEFDLEEAIQPLLQYAEESGVVDRYGAERAFAIIRAAFAGIAEL